MKLLRRLTAPLLATIVVATTVAHAEGQTHNVTMTRMMLVVSDLEKNLATAVSRHDQAGIDSLLSTDFEFRPGDHPGDPTTRADWLADAASAMAGDLEQLSVHELGDVAVASFIKAVPARDDKTRLSRSYVIDVWKKQGNDWQLITRYQSELPAIATPTEDIAPTGKG
jgi:ketosteroid isomerase-like protein